MRNESALRVTAISTAAFNVPPINSHSDGIECVREKYGELRRLIERKGAEPQWYRGGNRDPDPELRRRVRASTVKRVGRLPIVLPFRVRAGATFTE